MGKFNYNELTPLVKKVKKGDSNAFADLYSKTYQKVYFFALSLSRNEQMAQDIVQDTFLTALKSIQSLNDDKLFMAWLNKITYNTAMKSLGAVKPDSIDDESNFTEIADPKEDNDPLTASMRNDEKRQIVECIDTLPHKQRAIILLKYYEGLKDREIAEAMDIPVGTVKSRLNSAKASLKDALEKRRLNG